MKEYKVTMFILGLSPEITKEVEYVMAESEEQAEKFALWHRDGYGVLSTEEVTEEE